MTVFDLETDVVVVGSGGGALAAAVTAKSEGLDVIVVEKSSHYGGTTALSGGVIWVPNNHHAQELGITDSKEAAITYLRRIAGNHVAQDRMESYVDHGPRMVKHMEAHSQLKFSCPPTMPDYRPDFPGSAAGGRCLEAVPYDAGKLGDEFKSLNPPPDSFLVFGRFMLPLSDAMRLMMGDRSFGALKPLLNEIFRYVTNLPGLFRSKRSQRVAMGNGLIAPLRATLADQGVELWLETPAKSLHCSEDGVIGVTVERDGKPVALRARKGVILGAGGFGHNAALRATYHGDAGLATRCGAVKEDTGEAITMSQDAGAALDNMDEAWWSPTYILPGGEATPPGGGAERALPGSIIVNRAGRRICNEAGSFLDVGRALAQEARDIGAERAPAHLIFDSAFRAKNAVAGIAAGKAFPPAMTETGFVTQADDLETLAAKCGINAAGLAETVARFNGNANAGNDPDFGRQGSLGPIEAGPFFAVEQRVADIGTKGGVLTDARARALRTDGSVLKGLYAIGNSTASIMGVGDPGNGGTIGPSMVFGYIAAMDAAGKLDS